MLVFGGGETPHDQRGGFQRDSHDWSEAVGKTADLASRKDIKTPNVIFSF